MDLVVQLIRQNVPIFKLNLDIMIIAVIMNQLVVQVALVDFVKLFLILLIIIEINMNILVIFYMKLNAKIKEK